MGKLTLIGSTGTFLNIKSGENTPFALIKKIPNPESGTGEGSKFGITVAVNSRWIVIGAPQYPYRGTGTIDWSGKVYVYNAQTFEYVTAFQNSSYSSFTGTSTFDHFGASIVIVDGTTYDYIFVGTPGQTVVGGGTTRYGGVWKYQIRNTGPTTGTVTRVDTSTRGLNQYASSSPPTHYGGASIATDGTYIFSSCYLDHTADRARIVAHRVSDLQLSGTWATTTNNEEFGWSTSLASSSYVGKTGSIAVNGSKLVAGYDGATNTAGQFYPGLVYDYTTPSGLTNHSDYDYLLTDPFRMSYQNRYTFAFGGPSNQYLFAANASGNNDAYGNPQLYQFDTTSTSNITSGGNSWTTFNSDWNVSQPSLNEIDADPTNDKFGEGLVADDTYVIASVNLADLGNPSSTYYGGAFVFDINSGKILQKIRNPDADGTQRRWGVGMAYNGDLLIISDCFGSSTSGKKGAVYVYKRTR